MSTNSTFLKEMGITEWTSRDVVPQASETIVATEEVGAQSVGLTSETLALTPAKDRVSSGIWWFLVISPKAMRSSFFRTSFAYLV